MNKAITNNPRLSVQFNEDETRGRHTPAIPLTMTATTESSKSHRSSISFTAIADRIRRTRTRSSSRSKTRSSVDVPSDDEDYKYSKRRSSKIEGEYAGVARAQLAYMDKLRSYQAQNNITHNIHGLPIRKPEEHRFNWANMLGWGKPLLAR